MDGDRPAAARPRRARRHHRGPGPPTSADRGPGAAEGPGPTGPACPTDGGAQLRLLVLACTRERHDRRRPGLGRPAAPPGALARGPRARPGRPSTWSRPPWPTTPSATTWPSPRRSSPPACPATSAPCGAAGSATCCSRLAAPPDGPLLGFPGPAAPYWEFRGPRPSAALVVPTRGPQLIRRVEDGSTWVRFGWERDDVWLPVEDRTPPGPSTRPAGTVCQRQGPGHGAGLPAPVPAGRAQPAPRRPLLQGRHGRPAPELSRGRGEGPGPQRPSLPPAARSSAMAQPKATSRSPRLGVEPVEQLGRRRRPA